MKTKTLLNVIIITLTICVAYTAPATLICYDGADYTPGTDILFGQNGGTGWAEAWTNDGYATWNTGIAADSLAYTNAGRVLITTGNKFRNGSGDGVCRTIDTSAFPLLTTTEGKFGKPDTEIWVSMLINRYNTDRLSGIVFKEGWGWSGVERNRFGTSHENLSLNVYAYPLTSHSVTNNQTAFLVLRINFTNGNDSLTMWVNPRLGNSPPLDSSGWTGLADPVSDFTFDRIALRYIENKCEVDEIRIGESWADVAPHAVVSGWPALVITNTATTVNPLSSTYTIGGTSAYLTAMISWTNYANGAFGTVLNSPGFSIPDIPINPGINEIHISSGNSLGTVSDSITLTRLGLPEVTITSNWSLVTTEQIIIAGTANDETVGTMWWENTANESSGSFPATAYWQTSVTLAPGVNTITVYGTNSTGFVTNDVISVTRIDTTDLIAYDGAAYPVGMNSLVGQNGGYGWHEAWTNDGYASWNTTITEGSMEYGQDGKFLITSGNRFTVGAGDGARRTIASNGWESILAANGQFAAAGESLWCSMLVKRNSGNDQGYVTLLDGYGWSSIEKQHFGGRKWDANETWGNPDTGIPVLDDAITFLVARIDFTDFEENVTLWVNPPLGDSPPADTEGTTSTGDPDPDFTFFRARIRYGDYDFDEIRFGTTWNAVAPYNSVPETYPLVFITTPDQNVSATTSQITVDGTNNTHVAGMAWVLSTAPGQTNWFTRTGTSWSVDVTGLEYQYNTLYIAATNTAGQWYSDSIKVYREPLWPHIAISVPEFLYIRNDINQLQISGVNNVNAVGNFWWTDDSESSTQHPVTRNGTSWSTTITGLETGANLITVTATNTIGLVTNDTVTIIRNADMSQPVCLTTQSNLLYSYYFPFGRYLTGFGRAKTNLIFIPTINDSYGEYKWAAMNNGVWDNSDDFLDTWGPQSDFDSVGMWFKHPVSISHVIWQQRLFGDGGWFSENPVVEYTTSYMTGNEGDWTEMPAAVKSNSFGAADWYYLDEETNSMGSVSARFFWIAPGSFTNDHKDIRGIRIRGAASGIAAYTDTDGFVGFTEVEAWGYPYFFDNWYDAFMYEQGNLVPGRGEPTYSTLLTGDADRMVDGAFFIQQDGWTYSDAFDIQYGTTEGEAWYGVTFTQPFTNASAVGVEAVVLSGEGWFSNPVLQYRETSTGTWLDVPAVSMGSTVYEENTFETEPAFLMTFPALEVSYGFRLRGAPEGSGGYVSCQEFQVFSTTEIPEPTTMFIIIIYAILCSLHRTMQRL